MKRLPEEENPATPLRRLTSEFSFIKGNFLILLVSWVIMDFAGEIPKTYYPLYVKALGGSAATVGLIGSASTLALALVQFPGGYLADRYGRRWLIVSLTYGVALSYTLYIFAKDWRFILIGAIIQSLCLLYQPALNAITMDSLPSEKRGMGFSIVTLIVGVSSTPAPLIAGILYSRLGLMKGMRLAYGLVLAFYLAAATLRLRLRETIRETEPIRVGEMLSVMPRSLVEGLKIWRRLPRSASILLISGLIGVFAASLMEPLYALYAVEERGITPLQWSQILTVGFASMLLLAFQAGKFIDKAGRRNGLILAHLLWALALLLFLRGDFPSVMAAMPLIGLMSVLFHSSYSALMADLVPKSLRGRVSGSQSFFRLLLTSAGNLLGGSLYDRVSPSFPIQLQLPLLLPPLLLILLFLEEPERRED